MKHTKLILVFLLGLLLLTSCGGGDTPEDYTVKIGMLPYGSYLPLYIALSEGYFAEQGLNVEVIDFKTQSDAVIALAAGQIDVTGGLIDVATLAANAEGAGIKIVADKGYNDPNADCSYSSWMANQDLLDSGVLDDLSNMAGRKVILIPAGYLEYVMDITLAPAGLSTDDLIVENIPVPSRGEALQSGAVDVGLMGEPWISRMLATGEVGIWKTFEEIMPNSQLGVLWYGPTLTEDHPEIGNLFMVGYLKAVQQYNEGKTEQNVALMAEFTNSTIEEAQNTCWQPLEPNGNVNIDTVLDFQKWANENGYLDQTLTEDEIWDSRFLEYAQNHIND